jgi:hypothetical protein
MDLDYQNKVVIDIALNMGVLMKEGKLPNYGDFDYYEVLIKLANEFLLLPPPPLDSSNDETFYVVRIDKFAEKRLLEMFS